MPEPVIPAYSWSFVCKTGQLYLLTCCGCVPAVVGMRSVTFATLVAVAEIAAVVGYRPLAMPRFASGIQAISWSMVKSAEMVALAVQMVSSSPLLSQRSEEIDLQFGLVEVPLLAVASLPVGDAASPFAWAEFGRSCPCGEQVRGVDCL